VAPGRQIASGPIPGAMCCRWPPAPTDGRWPAGWTRT
jgi:hypothetical protein